jgi:hypothetical protein
MSKAEQQMTPPPVVGSEDTPKFSDGGKGKVKPPPERKSLAQERSEADRAGTASVEPEEVKTFPIWTDPENAPTERASVADDPTGESNTDLGGEGGEGETEEEWTFSVTVTDLYTLVVNGTPTTELGPTSNIGDIEQAILTADPTQEGLDVLGDPATTYTVDTLTQTELTATGGATVTVT